MGTTSTWRPKIRASSAWRCSMNSVITLGTTLIWMTVGRVTGKCYRPVCCSASAARAASSQTTFSLNGSPRLH